MDLLVYQPPTEDEPWNAERLKKTLLDLDPVHFYMTMPKDPAAEYRVLWYRQYYLGPGCKVDILLPGTMHLGILDRVGWLVPMVEEFLDAPMPEQA